MLVNASNVTLGTVPRRNGLFEAVAVLLGSFVLVAAAKIFVPFSPVPMTLATLAVMAIATVFGFRLGILTVLAYLGEGFAGLPVFTYTPPTIAGPIYFLGPTGGFLAGYLVLAGVAGYCADRGWARSPMKLFGVLLVGDAALFAMGFVWFAWFAHLSNGGSGADAALAWTKGIEPFILSDLLKIVLVAAAVPAGRRAVEFLGGGQSRIE
jgi:biotin transport system substrate-specific component